MQHIKNVIFDLGGVVMNLDFNKTFKTFENLSGKDFSRIFSKSKQFEFVSAYETGKISSGTFRDKIREALEIEVDDQTIDQAWNAMLLDFPLENIEYVKSVHLQKRTFILSNTNDIHKRKAEKILAETLPGFTWEDMSEKAYFSHIMGDRKPNESIFRTVLEGNNLSAKETLFVDDSPQHIEGAKKVGIHAIHLTNGITIRDLKII